MDKLEKYTSQELEGYNNKQLKKLCESLSKMNINDLFKYLTDEYHEKRQPVWVLWSTQVGLTEVLRYYHLSVSHSTFCGIFIHPVFAELSRRTLVNQNEHQMDKVRLHIEQTELNHLFGYEISNAVSRHKSRIASRHEGD